jgi:hypothetical protein
MEELPKEVQDAMDIQGELMFVFLNRLGVENSGRSPSEPDMIKVIEASRVIKKYNDKEGCSVLRLSESGIIDIYNYFEHYGNGLKELINSFRALDIITERMKN